jgi:hypothetical protein
MAETLKDCRMTRDEQVLLLEALGLRGPAPVLYADTARLISRALLDIRGKPATPRQQRYLSFHGVWLEGMTWGEASDLIGWIVQCKKGTR